MDISRLRQSQAIAGVAGIVLVISLFVDWGAGLTAFGFFSVMDIIMLLIGLAAIVYAALPAAGSAKMLPTDSAWILLLLTVAVVGFVVGYVLEVSGAGFGAWLALIASLALAYGAYSEVRGGPLTARMARAGAGAPPPGGAPTATMPPAGAGTGAATGSSRGAGAAGGAGTSPSSGTP
jgi:hypothetical protein